MHPWRDDCFLDFGRWNKFWDLLAVIGTHILHFHSALNWKCHSMYKVGERQRRYHKPCVTRSNWDLPRMHPHGYWWYVCGTDRNCHGTGNTYIDIEKIGGFLSLPAGYRINLSLGSLFHGFQLIKPGLNSELCPPPGTIALPGQSASDQTDFEISSHNVNIMFPQP